MNKTCPMKCPVCSECFSNSHNLEVHIATVHVFYTAYECEICQNALFPTDQSLREHYMKIHKKNIFNVKYKVSPELDQRKEMVRQMLAQAISANNELELFNPFTSQLLQSCTAQLIQEQLLRSAELLATTSEDDAAKMENNNHSAESNQGNSTDMAECSNAYKMNILESKYQPISIEKIDMEEMQSIADLGEEQQHSLMDNSLINLNSPKKQRGRRKRTAENGSEGASPVKNELEVECMECNRKVGKYRNSMLIHTSTHHCDHPIFECLSEGCGKKWYSLSARAKEHIESKHNGDLALLKDNRNELLPALKARTAELFPENYSHSSTVNLD